jgi:hypothetical protein
MEFVALATWVLTAGGGFFLLGLWLKNGGMQQSDQPGARIRAARVLTHFGLAATGLVLWIVYVATDSTALAWIAFAILLVVALLGFSMLAIWLGQRQRQGAAASAAPGATPPAEQSFPVATVVLHGLLAAITLVLVLLTASGVGS